MSAPARCPSCGKPMQPLPLTAHYGREVEVDLCGDCHLLWFDGHESVQLAGRGVLGLLRAIEATHGHAHVPLKSIMECPRCDTRLQRSANITALGPTAHHECPRGHGAAQSFSLYLAEKGFVRPLYRPEVEQLRKRPHERQVFLCVNCGAALDPREREACSHCASPVRVLDVLPLLRAVDRQTGQLAAGANTTAGLPHAQFACPHCGQAVDPARERRCSACAMPVALTDLRQAMAFLEPFVPAIEAEAPTREHRLQRLADSLDAAPVGVPPSRPAHGHTLPLRVYVIAFTVMLAVGLFLVWWARR
jgi:hypothetical protein